MENTTVEEGGVKEAQEKSILDRLGEGKKFTMEGIEFLYNPDHPEKHNLSWKTEHDHGQMDKEGLWAMAFMMGDEDMRERMIPVKIEEKRVFHKQIKIRVSRDLRKGEEIVTSVKFTVPLEMLVKATKSGLYVPKK